MLRTCDHRVSALSFGVVLLGGPSRVVTLNDLFNVCGRIHHSLSDGLIAPTFVLAMSVFQLLARQARAASENVPLLSILGALSNAKLCCGSPGRHVIA